MNKILEGLNEAQIKAVQDIDGYVLTLAGAGSGKTKVLTHRIAYLIDMGVSPKNILAVTFTNKAANEMKERIAKLVGNDAKDIWIGTFHNICIRVLVRFGEDIGIGRNFTIVDESEQIKLLKQCYEKIYNAKIEKDVVEKVEYTISMWKSNLIGPEEAIQANPKGVRGSLNEEANIYLEYQNALQLANSLDFDDIIMKTVQLIQNSERARRFVTEKFRYVLVDEFQDTNKAQYELIKLFVAKHKNLFVVGDDSQSIYGWRYADIGNILSFQQENNSKIHKLEQNYRSTKVILNAANAVIKNNSSQIEKQLWTKNSNGDKIIYYEGDNEYEEALMVVRLIESLIDLKYKRPSDFAILYRTNMQSRAIEDALIRRGIPYQVIGATSFYERKEIKDMLAYMRFICNSADSLSLSRIINVPKRGIGDTTMKKIIAYAVEHEISIWDALKDIENLPIKLTKNPKEKIMEFVAMMQDLMDFANEPGRDAAQVLRAIWEVTGYVKELEEDGSEEELERADNLDELLNIAREYDANAHDESNKLLYFLTNISLIADADTIRDTTNSVKLMTVHAAKGLEFPYVFIVGLEEGKFPHSTAIAAGQGELEEERRLFYVAITRAKKRLYISMARKRSIYGIDPDFVPKNKPSRFLEEIPKDLIIRI